VREVRRVGFDPTPAPPRFPKARRQEGVTVHVRGFVHEKGAGRALAAFHPRETRPTSRRRARRCARRPGSGSSRSRSVRYEYRSSPSSSPSSSAWARVVQTAPRSGRRRRRRAFASVTRRVSVFPARPPALSIWACLRMISLGRCDAAQIDHDGGRSARRPEIAYCSCGRAVASRVRSDDERVSAGAGPAACAGRRDRLRRRRRAGCESTRVSWSVLFLKRER